MLDFRSERRQSPPDPTAIPARRSSGRPVGTVGRPPIVPGVPVTKPKASLLQHEWRIMATLPIAVGMIGWLIWSLVAAPADQRKPVRSGPIVMQTAVPAMAQPTLDAAEPLPSREQLAAQAEPLSALAEHPGNLALVGTDLDGLTLAWGLQQLAGDRLALPIPGRPTATDLVDREIRLGSPVVVEGRLVDARREAIPSDPAASTEKPTPDAPAELGRLILALDDGQFAQAVISDPAAVANLVAGEPAQVVGRYAGSCRLPRQDGKGEIRLPLLIARTAAKAVPGPVQESPYRTSFSALPSGIFAEVDDERTVLETRPYYFLLGQVSADRAYTDPYVDAASVNLTANELHQNPQAFRASPRTMRMTVYESWEDPLVARDQPFGVRRCVRILGYRRDWSPMSVTDAEGKPMVKNQLVIRLFEVAVAVNDDRPLPEKGADITTAGRFLKIRAIPVEPDPRRDQELGIRRQRKDRAYAFLFVANDWKVVPSPFGIDFTGLTIALLCALAALGVLVVWSSRKDSVGAERMRGVIGKLRQQRRAVDSGKRSPATGSAASDDRTEPAADDRPTDSRNP